MKVNSHILKKGVGKNLIKIRYFGRGNEDELWVVNIEMYDEDGIFLAGAAINPDTLELQREIAPYSEERVAEELEEKAIAEESEKK